MSAKPIRVEALRRVTEHYFVGGWTVISVPAGSLVDLIAAKGSRMHFIRVITPDEILYSTGLAKNEYIQNAFSNSATPVFAMVGAGTPTKYKYLNPNTNTRVTIQDKSARKPPVNNNPKK
jgi:hypothetical protein